MSFKGEGIILNGNTSFNLTVRLNGFGFCVLNIFIMNSTGIESIEIYSTSGEKMITQSVSGREELVHIDVSRLHTGLCLIRALNKVLVIITGKLSKEQAA